MSKMSRIELKNDIKTLLNYLRTLLSEDTDAPTIDVEYEESVLKSIDMIPDFVIPKISIGLAFGKILLKSIDFRKFADNFHAAPKLINPETFDLYSYVMAIIYSKVQDTATRLAVKLAMKKFKPLFKCVTIIVKNPQKYVDKLVIIAESNKFDSIILDNEHE